MRYLSLWRVVIIAVACALTFGCGAIDGDLRTGDPPPGPTLAPTPEPTPQPTPIPTRPPPPEPSPHPSLDPTLAPTTEPTPTAGGIITGEHGEVRDLVAVALLDRTSRDNCVRTAIVDYDFERLYEHVFALAEGEPLGQIDKDHFIGSLEAAGTAMLGGVLIGNSGDMGWFVESDFKKLPRRVKQRIRGSALAALPLLKVPLPDGRTAWYRAEDYIAVWDGECR